ncbi:MAG TPA: peptidase MA family metallohydrolase [Dehalococcoidia bacterium]
MKTRLGLALALVFVASAAAMGRPAPAFADIEVRSQPPVQNLFPNGVRLTIFLASNAEIRNVRLAYRVLPAGPPSSTRPQCSSGTQINCTVNLTKDIVYLAPGAEVRYSWEVEDAAGQKLTTPESSFTYQDDRFQWEPAAGGDITAYAYLVDSQTVQTVLRVARETMDRFSALEGTQIDFPVKIWVYQTANDLQPAAAGDRRDGVHALGQQVADDTILVSRDTDFLNIVRHEMAHIVTDRATRGQIGVLPIWINEGLSTYAQSRLIPGEEQAFDLALRTNRMLPITSLNASTRDAAGTVGLFYAQSGSIVRYLIEKYGDAKFGQFIAAFKDETTNGALAKVYGFDLLGLEQEWRRSLGLPPVSGGDGQRPAATSAPSGDQDGQATAPEGKGGGSSSLFLIVAGVAGVLLIGGAGAYLLWSMRAKPSA